MKKSLRLFLLSALVLFAGQSFAEEVTIDFDNGYQTLFPGLVGVSSGSGATYVDEGDFTETTTSTPVDGVTVTVTPSTTSTPNRIWGTSPRFRMYSGELTVSGTDITKIVFNSNSNFNLTATTGTLTDKTWTSEASSEVVFTVSKNTQLKSIVVTLGQGGEVTPPDPVKTDVNVAEALAVIEGLADGASTNETYKVKGIVVGTPDFQRKDDGTLYGNVNFTMGDNAASTSLLTVFRAKYFGNVNFTEETISKLKEGDEVIVSGQLQKYVKEGEMTPEITGCYVTSINGKTEDDTPVTPVQTTGDGSLANPYTAADANAVAGQMASGATTTESYYIKGKISAITYAFDADHGTATFYISDDGTENNQFYVYGTYYLNNRAWVDGDTQIAPGDEVIIYGQLANYQGTPETASKKSYIYSLNGVTDGGQVVVPDATKVGSIAQLLAMGGTNNVELTLTNAKVLFVDNNYIYVRENGAALCFYKIDAFKKIVKNNAIVSGTIRVDYEVYKLLPEVKANNFTTADALTVTESEEEAEPVQTTLTAVDNGDHVCDLVTLTAKLVREVAIKEDGSEGQATYYLEDEESRLVVVNNSKNLKKLADEGVETITVTGIVNTNNDAYQVKLVKDAVNANAAINADVNGDGVVDVADISTILTVMAGDTSKVSAEQADVNGDGNVDVADISTVLSVMAGE